jgi:hypothetical protein
MYPVFIGPMTATVASRIWKSPLIFAPHVGEPTVGRVRPRRFVTESAREKEAIDRIAKRV